MRYRDTHYVVSPYRFRWAPFDFNDAARDAFAFIETAPPDVELRAVVSHLRGKYAASRTTIERDLRAFLDDCIARDLLISADLDIESDRALDHVHAMQARTPTLTVTNFGYEVRLGPSLTPGCQACSRGTWAIFNIGARCNLDCWFCPYTPEHRAQPARDAGRDNGIASIGFLGARFRSARDLQFQFSLVRDRFDAIAWVGGEPMLPALRGALLPLIRAFHQAYPAYHQWVYTNGTFAAPRRMRELADAGISELRFNLAATGFSRTVIRRMREARKIFRHVCLESPMTARAYRQLMAHASEIVDTGLDQMNLAEFIVGRRHLAHASTLAREGRLYCYKGFICSPVLSRQYTYAVIQRAVEERWPVVINDCSNEYKYYKLSRKHRGPGPFEGCLGYWDNGYALREIDRFNQRLGQRPDRDRFGRHRRGGDSRAGRVW